jgi:hypothetical protein
VTSSSTQRSHDDFYFIGLIVVFFALTAGLIRFCAKLMRDGAGRELDLLAGGAALRSSHLIIALLPEIRMNTSG